MKLSAALLVIVAVLVLVAFPVFGQNTPQSQPQPQPSQGLSYPRRPPKEWTTEFKDMKKRAARAQAKQAKVNKENETDIAMVNAENTHLNSTLPQGAGYDEALDLWIPGPAPIPVTPKVVDPTPVPAAK